MAGLPQRGRLYNKHSRAVFVVFLEACVECPAQWWVVLWLCDNWILPSSSSLFLHLVHLSFSFLPAFLSLLPTFSLLFLPVK